MNRNSALFACFAFFLLLAGAAAFYYGKIPELMPTHWDIYGHVNGYMPKLWGMAIPLIVIAAECACIFVLPLISPKAFRLDQFIQTFYLFAVAISALLFVVGLVVFRAASGENVHVQTIMPGLLGAFLIVTGNYMGKLRKNFFIGVRTPWTLANDEVWARTHRFAGRLFVLGGVACIVEAVTGPSAILFASVIIAIVVIPFAYSFYAYKRIEGFGPEGS